MSGAHTTHHPGCIWASLQANHLWISSVPGQFATPPGFLTLSGCGCNTVSCTVIDRRVLRCQAAELHVGCAGGFVYSQCGLALELLVVASTTIVRINFSNPLKALSMALLHPVHVVASEWVTRSLAGYLHWSPRLHQLRSRLLQLDLAMDTYGEKVIVDVIVTSGPVSTSDLELVSPLPAVPDRRKRKIQLHPMVRVSVFSVCGEDIGHMLFSGCWYPCF